MKYKGKYDSEYKSIVTVVNLGRYIENMTSDTRIHICSDDFYINCPVYVLRADLKHLLIYEVSVNEYFPYTVYL